MSTVPTTSPTTKHDPISQALRVASVIAGIIVLILWLGASAQQMLTNEVAFHLVGSGTTVRDVLMQPYTLVHGWVSGQESGLIVVAWILELIVIVAGIAFEMSHKGAHRSHKLVGYLYYAVTVVGFIVDLCTDYAYYSRIDPFGTAVLMTFVYTSFVVLGLVMGLALILTSDR